MSMSSSSTSTKPQQQEEKVVIIGAGPAGLMLGCFLALSFQQQQQQQQETSRTEKKHPKYKIEIYERRSDPRRLSLSQPLQRSYPISLQPRGLKVIRQFPGLEAALEKRGVWSCGSLMHHADKDDGVTKPPRKIERKTPHLVVDRNILTIVLMEYLLEHSSSTSTSSSTSSSVTIEFNCTCTFVDPNNRTVTLQKLLPNNSNNSKSVMTTTTTANSTTSILKYDRLVAADGARSNVRESLVHLGALKSEQELVPDAYKTIVVPSSAVPVGALEDDNVNDEDNSSRSTFQLSDEKFHIWMLGDGVKIILGPTPPPSTPPQAVVAHDAKSSNKSSNDNNNTVSRKRNWLQGVFIFPPDQNPLEACEDAESVRAYFCQQCPAVAKLMSLEEAEALCSSRRRPVARSLTVRCDRMNVSDRIVLLGDAAHAVSASLGQGCNAALEDVMVLYRILEQTTTKNNNNNTKKKHHHDWSRALSRFTAERLPDVHALRELSDYSMPRSKWMLLEFVVHVTIGKWLRKWFPSVFGHFLFKPLPMDLIMEGESSYSSVLQQSRWWVDRVKRSCQQK